MIPIADPDVGDAELDRIREVLDSGHLADGPVVREFESAFADYCGAEHAVAMANGTAALHAALVALGIGEGDTVLTTPLSFVASANAVRLAGATPVFADVDPETFTLDPSSVEDVLQERDVDAVLPVHLYGLSADLGRIGDLADEYDCALLEDCAQAHGATYRGRRVGSVGDAGAFSFYPTKNMTTGEGGVVVTDRDDVAARLRRFVNHGRDGSGRHVEVGHNFRMPSVAAAVGREQLEKLPTYTRKRREHAARLTEGLDDVPGVETPAEPPERRHVYHQYTVRAADRDALQAHLSDAGVGTGVYYSRPIHEEPAYDDVAHDAPAAERAADEVLSLPVHPSLSDEQVDTVVEEVRRVAE